MPPLILRFFNKYQLLFSYSFKNANTFVYNFFDEETIGMLRGHNFLEIPLRMSVLITVDTSCL